MISDLVTPDKELENFGYTPKLLRTLKTWQLVSFGLTYLQPIGPAVIFGFLLTTSKGTVALPYLLAFVGMIFTIQSYSILIKEYPLAGSIYNYVKYAIGPSWGFIAGWLLSLDYILIPTITAVSAAIYAHQLIPYIPYETWLIGFVLAMGLLNLIGIRSTSYFSTAMLIIQISIVLGGFAIWIIFLLKSTKSIESLFSMKPFHFESIRSVIQASSLAIFSFLGFDAVTTLAEESINPRKDIPRAMLICTCIGVIIMILTGYLGMLIIPDWKVLVSERSWTEATLFKISIITGGEIFASVYTVGFILAMIITNLVGTAAATRLLYGMGRDNVISSRIFSSVNQRWQTPHGSILVIIVVELILGSLISQEQLGELISFGAIVGFILLNFSVIFLGQNVEYKQLKLKNIIKQRIYWCLKFIIYPLTALMIMLAMLLNMNLMTILVGSLWGIGGLAYYLNVRHCNKHKCVTIS